MAQNEIQKYENDDKFIINVRQPCETFYNNYQRLEKMANFLNSATATDYPANTHPKINATLTALANLRTEINTYLAAQTTTDMLDEIKKFVQI